MGLFSSIIDPGNVFGGNDGGVSVSGIFDPGGTILDSAGLMPDFYSDTSGKIDDWAGDLAAFEGSQLSDWWQKFKNDPTQLLIGAGDPFSAKMWSGITGKEYTPYVNQMGGPTNEAYQSAERKGIDTSNSRGSHQVAGAIASYYGAGALGNAFGNAGTAAGIGARGGQALGGAAVGAGNAWANDQNVWKGAMAGGLGSYLQGLDYAGSMGLGDLNNPLYRRALNGAIGGGLSSGLSGENAGIGALYGAGKGAASGAGDMYFNDMPNEGTLGGTYQDEFGENSATMGGYSSPQQQEANVQASGLSGTYGVPQGFSKSASMGNESAPQESSAVDALISALSDGAGYVSKNAGGLSDLVAQGMGMYDASRQRRRAKEQIAGLNTLYAPNSPYAQQMRQRMERQDAASGRRSQYGVRETELAAKLADAQARLAPQINQLYGQDSAARGNMIRDGLRMGQGLYKLYNGR